MSFYYHILTIKICFIFYNIFAIYCLIDIITFIVSVLQFLDVYSNNGFYDKKMIISNLNVSYRIFKIIKFLNLMSRIIVGSNQRVKFYHNNYSYRVYLSYTQYKIDLLLFDNFYIVLVIISDLFI